MTTKFDADGLDWDDDYEFCAVPCGRAFDDREEALAHIDRCQDCVTASAIEATANAIAVHSEVIWDGKTGCSCGAPSASFGHIAEHAVAAALPILLADLSERIHATANAWLAEHDGRTSPNGALYHSGNNNGFVDAISVVERLVSSFAEEVLP